MNNVARTDKIFELLEKPLAQNTTLNKPRQFCESLGKRLAQHTNGRSLKLLFEYHYHLDHAIHKNTTTS